MQVWSPGQGYLLLIYGLNQCGIGGNEKFRNDIKKQTFPSLGAGLISFVSLSSNFYQQQSKGRVLLGGCSKMERKKLHFVKVMGEDFENTLVISGLSLCFLDISLYVSIYPLVLQVLVKYSALLHVRPNHLISRGMSTTTNLQMSCMAGLWCVCCLLWCFVCVC